MKKTRTIAYTLTAHEELEDGRERFTYTVDLGVVGIRSRNAGLIVELDDFPNYAVEFRGDAWIPISLEERKDIVEGIVESTFQRLVMLPARRPVN